jgi:hypothetical protein
MATDEEVLTEGQYWALQLDIGEEITLNPGDNHAIWVTDVFLVDPESANGQGAIAACVETGTRNIILAELSSEVTDVELLAPLVLDKEFCFYVAQEEGESEADTNADADAVVVQFEGFVLPLPSPDTEEGNKEGEEAAEEESQGEVEPNVVRASSAGGNTKDVLHIAARIFVVFLFVCVLALLRFMM